MKIHEETNFDVPLEIIRASEVEPKEVKWLWYPFIPYGKLTIIQGDPGDGKSTFILNIAAMLSKGMGFDGDMVQGEPVNVIYQTAEDGLADTVKPRLESAGADCARISIIDESEKSVSLTDATTPARSVAVMPPSTTPTFRIWDRPYWLLPSMM